MDKLQLLDDEGLFSRDLDGHLLRRDEPTLDMLDESRAIVITIDGQDIRVPEATAATNGHGDLVYDERGYPVPRLTTILDAVAVRYGDGLKPVPVLCHREHMTPAAVCRVCAVQVARRDREGILSRPDPKLVPACYQPIVEGMVVDTMASPDAEAAARVRHTVRLLVELLAADHLHRGAHPANELEALADDLGVAAPRFGRPPHLAPPEKPAAGAARGTWSPGRPLDDSSPWFVIDRTACILCDRCVRGCGEVRGHLVIARAQKGSEARIAFDWDAAMGKSSCVLCGECFISCPTDAITMKPGVKPSPWDFPEDEGEPADEPGGPPPGWLARLLHGKGPP